MRRLVVFPLVFPLVSPSAFRLEARQPVEARRRLLLGLAGLAASGLVPALALPSRAEASQLFPFIPDHYTFTHAQVLAAVARKFPYRRTLAQVFELSLTNPAVGFEADVTAADQVDAIAYTRVLIGCRGNLRSGVKSGHHQLEIMYKNVIGG